VALDVPARDRVQGRRAERGACTQAETRVVQWAPDGVADEEPFRERPTVVRARGAHGERLITVAREYDGLATGMPEYHPTVGEISDRAPVGGKIGPAQRWSITRHYRLLP
jgi:hypothetical protein